jgi:hypothetical protein
MEKVREMPFSSSFSSTMAAVTDDRLRTEIEGIFNSAKDFR